MNDHYRTLEILISGMEDFFSLFNIFERRKFYDKKKEPGLIVSFDENDSDFEMQKFEVEKFFRFFTEIAKGDFLKNLE